MSRWHAAIWSHPGHYLVDYYIWPTDHFWLRYSKFNICPWKLMVKVMSKVKPNGHIWGLKFNRYVSFCFVAIGPFLVEIWQIPYSISKIQSQGHGQGQTLWSHLRPWVQSICLLFISWQSDHFWLRYSQLHVWPWKFKVKVMAKAKLDGPIWGLEFNRYVCFSFRGNRTSFGWDMANSIFDLENSRSRSQRKSTKI